MIRWEQETISYEYDAAGNKIRERSEDNGDELTEETTYTFNEFNQITASAQRDTEGSLTSEKSYTYDDNGNQIRIADSQTDIEQTFSYDADNRLVNAESKTGTTVDYTQQNQYNGFGQRIRKTEGADVTNYFYDGTSVLYTTDTAEEVTSANLIGAEDNILTTARPKEDGSMDFYTYTKDMRESTINILGSDGSSEVSYSYDDYGETVELGDGGFYNEVCYSAGIYDKTTGLYYLNARYYDPATGNFLTQDTYRGDRSRTATINLYGYCAGNPVNYTDPSGHWIWGVVGAAMGAHDGYKDTFLPEEPKVIRKAKRIAREGKRRM